jgi:hypothetical membrane protein
MVAIIFITISIYYSPWFSWSENWLSELAGLEGEKPIYSAYGASSLLFNIGLILAGSLGLVCAVGIRNIDILDSKLSRFGTFALMLDMFALIAVGMFPLTTGLFHDASAIILFLLIPISLIPIGLGLTKTNEKKAGWFIFTLGIISVCSLPFYLISPPLGSNAIIEMFSVFSLYLCLILFGVYLSKGKFVLS